MHSNLPEKQQVIVRMEPFIEAHGTPKCDVEALLSCMERKSVNLR